MKTNLSTRRQPKPSEEGYILVAVMFMLALLVIAMAVAAPKIAKSIQRDRELETMHRGKQYARAVKLYYKKFGAYPPNVDALVKTNEIRFLRKKYIDPTTGKDEWKVVRLGQQKTQSLGFFGQPIGGTGVNTNTGLSGSPGMAGGLGSPNGGGSSGGIGSGGIGSNSGSTDSGSGSSGTSGSSTDPSSGGNGQAGGTSGTASGTGSGSGSAFGSGTGLSGQSFGGAGIMGFSPNSPKQSILVYKKKNHYNEWEFLYDPVAEQMMMQGGNTGAVGQPASGMPGSSPIGGSGIGGGSTFGGSSGSGFGTGSGIGTPGGTNPGGTTPTPQQQQ